MNILKNFLLDILVGIIYGKYLEKEMEDDF